MSNLPQVTVPGFVAGVMLADEPDLLDALSPFGREVGNHVELDLVAVADAGGEAGLALGSLLARYLWQCRSFWSGWAAGQPVGRYVRVERKLIEAAQRSTKSCKQDLNAELDALLELPAVGELVEELTGPEPDVAMIAPRLEAFGEVVQREGETNVSLAIEGIEAWPAALGGAPSAGELRRLIRLRILHAAWRDRRGRRLVGLRVDADEVWPEPEALPAGLADEACTALRAHAD